MLMQMPGTAMMDGRLAFDLAVGPMLVVALVVVLALGLVTEAHILPDLRNRLRRRTGRGRRLASVTTRL
jgi:hypothetical protein